MVECMRTAARDSKTERIKVSCLDIIITMIGKKPYYEIKYKEIGEDYYHVGYSSYKLENVLAWKDECFEIVKECRPQTNADRIRSMTDEELAKWFDAVTKDILGGCLSRCVICRFLSGRCARLQKQSLIIPR